MPVIAGEKPENERFPGAVATYSIEAMMQDGKALQAGTSHYLGTELRQGAEHPLPERRPASWSYCHTTSWGVSTRLIGGVIMTHGDDDGLRLPPAIAPRQVVIVPILRDKPEDAEVLAYGEALAKALTRQHGARRARCGRCSTSAAPASADKRWDWVRRGRADHRRDRPARRRRRPGHLHAPRPAARRREDRLATPCRATTSSPPRRPCWPRSRPACYAEAKARLDANIRSDIHSFDELAEYFGAAADDEDEGSAFKGWVRAPWSRPTGAALEAVDERLKALKLTLRNTPLDQTGVSGPCLFTGEPAVEEVLIARAY